MKEIGLFEAKTNLSKIVEQVNRSGRSVTLTKRGKPIADLVPHQPATPKRRSQAEVFADIDELRSKLPKIKYTQAQIKADIALGRR